MSEKESLQLKIRIAMRVTIIFVIVMVVSIAAELVIIGTGSDSLLCKNLIKLFGALALISPFGIMIPLFFRVNYQSRLILLQRKGRTGKSTNPDAAAQPEAKSKLSLGKESE